MLNGSRASSDRWKLMRCFQRYLILCLVDRFNSVYWVGGMNALKLKTIPTMKRITRAWAKWVTRLRDFSNGTRCLIPLKSLCIVMISRTTKKHRSSLYLCVYIAYKLKCVLTHFVVKLFFHCWCALQCGIHCWCCCCCCVSFYSQLILRISFFFSRDVYLLLTWLLWNIFVFSLKFFFFYFGYFLNFFFDILLLSDCNLCVRFASFLRFAFVYRSTN